MLSIFKNLRVLVTLGLGLTSSMALLGALSIEYIAHVPVCPLCWYQRWIHVLIAVMAAWGLWRRRCPLKLSLVLYGLGFALALYHVGLERAWWTFSALCPSRFSDMSMTPEQVRMMLTTPLADAASCHQVFMKLGGISLAEWNAVLMGGGTLILSVLARYLKFYRS